MSSARTILAAALLCLMPLPGLSSEEEILEPSEATLRAHAGKPFGEVSLTIRAKGHDAGRRISEIKLRVSGKSVAVPDKSFNDLAVPLLNTLELRTCTDFEGKPWLYIVFQLAHRTAEGQWRPKKVHIAYHAGRIESRSIETPNADGSSTHHTEKL